MKGVFITFEGGDGAGKTTLIDHLFTTLIDRGLKVLKTRAPGGSKIGEKIRDLVLHTKDAKLSSRTELFLFLADRAQHAEEIILPALNQGYIVLCDRFNDSTVAYQGIGRDFGEKYIKDLCAFASSGLQPTLTLYLDLDPKIGMQRIQKTQVDKDRIESEKTNFHEVIRKAFHKIAQEEPKRFHLLDANRSPDVVYEQALNTINAIL